MWEMPFERMLRAIIREGRLAVVLPDGTLHEHGDGTGPLVTLRFTDQATLRRILLNPLLAVGEAYLDGRMTIDDDDLRGFMTIAARNMGQDHRTRFHAAVDWMRTALRRFQQVNPMWRARRNVAHHYDLSDELYRLFLDEDRQYSCGYFKHPGDSLEQAQAQKKAHIAGKLCLENGMRVLDIGCGWGGLALTLARDHGARVLGVTLSEEQFKVATKRARAEGLEDRVEFRLTDYREVTGHFDRIVSVGMFEHVGVPHYGEYFRTVHDRLTADGVALIHTIGRSTPPGFTSPWIRKYIFPGGYIPAMSEVLRAVEKQGLWATDIEVWRLHYAETLRHWHERFTRNRDRICALYDERFCRMWAYYLVGSEMTFRYNRQCVFQFQLARHQQAVPLTRDYLYPVPKPRHRAEAAE